MLIPLMAAFGESPLFAGSVNIPFEENSPEKFERSLNKILEEDRGPLQRGKAVVVICRKGNDSQRVVQVMRQSYGFQARDLRGGLLGISTLDQSFPVL
jgi:rhodanese-related sulfurtransferase